MAVAGGRFAVQRALQARHVADGMLVGRGRKRGRHPGQVRPRVAVAGGRFAVQRRLQAVDLPDSVCVRRGGLSGQRLDHRRQIGLRLIGGRDKGVHLREGGAQRVSVRIVLGGADVHLF